MNMFKGGNARLAAAAGTLMLAGLGYGAPSIAHPHADEGEKKVEKVIILREGPDGAHHGKGKRVRTFHIERDGAPGDGEHVRVIRIPRDGKGDGRRVFRMHRDGPPGPDGPGRVRAFRMDGEGLAHCDGERTEIDEATGDDARERTRILVCGKSDMTSAQRIEKLEKAIDRIASNDEISAEHKERVTAALRGAIERLRATP